MDNTTNTEPIDDTSTPDAHLPRRDFLKKATSVTAGAFALQAVTTLVGCENVAVREASNGSVVPPRQTDGPTDSLDHIALAKPLAVPTSADTGAQLVGFKQTKPNGTSYATTTVERSVHNKLTEIISVLDFGTTPNAAMINNAITAVAETTPGRRIVVVPPGMYELETTVIVRTGVHLQLDKGATFKPVSNINVVEMERDSAITGGTIDCSLVTNFDKAAIYLHGLEKFTSASLSCTIKDIRLTSGVDSNAFGRGTGIHMDTGTDSGNHISGVYVDNVRIFQFHDGILIEAKTPNPSTATVWANGNLFSHIHFGWCRFMIRLLNDETNSGSVVNGNVFSDVVVQPGNGSTAKTERVLKCEGRRNQFTGFSCFDLGNLFADQGQQTYAVEFTSSSRFNFGSFQGVAKTLVGDAGTYNDLFLNAEVVLGSSVTAPRLTAQSTDPDTVALAATGAANQRANLFEVQSTGNGALLAVDKAGHIVTGGNTPAFSGGEGMTGSITVEGTDAAGLITITTSGVAPQPNATVATLTYDVAFAAPPRVIVTPANPSAAELSGAGTVYASATQATASKFELKVGGTALATNSVVNILNYSEVGYTRLPRAVEPSRTNTEDQL